MRLKTISFLSPEENILFDDVLLSLAEQSRAGEALRFWESKTPFVVLGKTSSLNDDVKLDMVRRDNIPVLRRSSAGGTVLQGEGCLNFSLILSKKRHPDIQKIHSSYKFILRKVVNALSALGLQSQMRSPSDIVIFETEKKFSGNAQKRGRHFILHHGTILCDFSIRLIEKYLKIPKQIPEYRKDRSHYDFLENILRAKGDVKKEIINQFEIESTDDILNIDEEKLLRKFCDEKDIFLA